METLGDTLEDNEAQTLCSILRHVEAETAIETLADKLGKAEAERLDHTLCDVEMEVLIETMANTVLERNSITLIKTIAAVETNNCSTRCLIQHLTWRPVKFDTHWLTRQRKENSKHLGNCCLMCELMNCSPRSQRF